MVVLHNPIGLESKKWVGPSRARGAQAYNWVWGRSPHGVPLQGQSLWRGPPLKLKAFCPFLDKKWSKVKDINENLPQACPRV